MRSRGRSDENARIAISAAETPFLLGVSFRELKHCEQTDARDDVGRARAPRHDVRNHTQTPGHTGALGHTDHMKNLTTIQTHQLTRTTARPRDDRKRIRGQLNSRIPGCRNRTLPASDSEEAAPSEPDPVGSQYR